MEFHCQASKVSSIGKILSLQQEVCSECSPGNHPLAVYVAFFILFMFTFRKFRDKWESSVCVWERRVTSSLMVGNGCKAASNFKMILILSVIFAIHKTKTRVGGAVIAGRIKLSSIFRGNGEWMSVLYLTAPLTSLLSAPTQLLHFRMELSAFVLTSLFNCEFSLKTLW